MGEHRPLVAVTFPVDTERLAELLGGAARVETVADLPDEERARTLQAADVLFAWNWRRELRPAEGSTLGVRFVQLLSAGADHLPFDQLPPDAVLASNAGAYAEPMAEHAVAMALALLKRLPQHHAELAAGVWDQSSFNRSMNGAVCGILGSIGCILVPSDGLALFLFEGPSAATVHNQSTRAEVPFDRIVEAVQIEPAEKPGW